ncbi:hypothetical protein LTR40_005171 [Exophiala xenobiotica]|nr:hypothetical protein LTR40_005171 [Exophiala xenobiotica]
MAEPKIEPGHVEAYNVTRANDTYSDVDIQHVRKGSAGGGLDAVHEDAAVGYKEYREALEVEVSQRDVGMISCSTSLPATMTDTLGHLGSTPSVED